MNPSPSERRAVGEKFTHWDPVDNLKTEEDMALYLNACLDEDSGDGALVCLALKDIAQAKGMVQLAMDSGMTREELYKALAADGNPELSTVLKVVKALGLQFHAVPVKAKKAIRKRPAGQSATTL